VTHRTIDHYAFAMYRSSPEPLRPVDVTNKHLDHLECALGSFIERILILSGNNEGPPQSSTESADASVARSEAGCQEHPLTLRETNLDREAIARHRILTAHAKSSPSHRRAGVQPAAAAGTRSLQHHQTAPPPPRVAV